MNNEPKTDQPPEPRDGVAKELIDQLHQANEQLTHARKHVDAAQAAEYGGLIERERASNDVRDAEKELEKMDERIGQALKEKEKPA